MTAKLPAGAWDTHCHVFPMGFPPAVGNAAPAEGDGLAAYRALAARLGVATPVFVQSNAYRLDNAALVATLSGWGEGARGVAAVAPATSNAELQHLHDAGVRGARVMDLGGGAVPLSQLEATIAMVRPFGWTTIVQFDGADLPKHADRLAAIEGNWVLDHYGKFLSAPPSTADLDMLCRLMDGGCHVKFAAAYEFSRTGAPDYEDVATIARRLITHAPERVIWGSNWPHAMNAPDDKPDDLGLLEAVLDWIPERDRNAVFVETPRRLFA